MDAKADANQGADVKELSKHSKRRLQKRLKKDQE